MVEVVSPLLTIVPNMPHMHLGHMIEDLLGMHLILVLGTRYVLMMTRIWAHLGHCHPPLTYMAVLGVR